MLFMLFRKFITMSYQTRYKTWKEYVKEWAKINNLTLKEAYKFLKLIYLEEKTYKENGWRNLKWAEFDIYIDILKEELINE